MPARSSVVIVDATGEEPSVAEELGLSVTEVFEGGAVASLTDRRAIVTALGRLRNVLAELAALYLALRLVPEEAIAAP